VYEITQALSFTFKRAVYSIWYPLVSAQHNESGWSVLPRPQSSTAVDTS